MAEHPRNPPDLSGAMIHCVCLDQRGHTAGGVCRASSLYSRWSCAWLKSLGVPYCAGELDGWFSGTVRSMCQGVRWQLQHTSLAKDGYCSLSGERPTWETSYLPPRRLPGRSPPRLRNVREHRDPCPTPVTGHSRADF